MERTYINEAFNKKNGVEVEVYGWVHELRDLNKIRFIVLRDITGKIQITGFKGKTEEKIFDLMKSIPKESVVIVRGKLKDSKQAPGGKEVFPEKIEIISIAEKLLPMCETCAR